MTEEPEVEDERAPEQSASEPSTHEPSDADDSETFGPEPTVTVRKKSISWTIINFWLDAALGVVFLAGLWTAFITRFVFPPATAAEGWRLWGYNYNQWSDLTFVLTCLLGGGIVVHVMLHWSWVCGVVTGRLLPHRAGKRRSWNDGERTLIGVGMIVLVLGVLGVGFACAMLTVQAP